MPHDTPVALLGGLSPAEFLRDYWQKKPLLVRNAFPDWQNPLEPDELAGLACEEDAESRLVLTREGKQSWVLKNGPFNEKTFARLPQRDWTLLVQAVDQWVPEVEALIEPFRFIPAWRTDDVMISYAPAGGSVGPHFDYYDVFLIQGLGQRRWQVGQHCDSRSPLLPDTQLRILAEFEQQDEWVLNPGDMLYLPPGVAHWGIAENDCMTYSVGFRAPSHGEIIDHLGGDVADTLSEDLRYGDPTLQPAGNPGEITPEAIAQLQAIIRQHLDQPRTLARWFGGFMTEAKYPDQEHPPEQPLSVNALKKRASRHTLCRHPASRLAYSALEGEFLLFADGEAREVTGEAAQQAVRLLCAERAPAPEALLPLLDDADCAALLCDLHNKGSLWFGE